MRIDREIEVHLNEIDHDTHTTAKIQVQDWTQTERTLRALKFGGICWGLAGFCVLIPILHFFLVPAFFLAGPVAAFIAYNGHTMILSGTGPCPYCKEPFEIPKSGLRFPMLERCPKCQRTVTVTAAT